MMLGIYYYNPGYRKVHQKDGCDYQNTIHTWAELGHFSSMDEATRHAKLRWPGASPCHFCTGIYYCNPGYKKVHRKGGCDYQATIHTWVELGHFSNMDDATKYAKLRWPGSSPCQFCNGEI